MILSLELKCSYPSSLKKKWFSVSIVWKTLEILENLTFETLESKGFGRSKTNAQISKYNKKWPKEFLAVILLPFIQRVRSPPHSYTVLLGFALINRNLMIFVLCSYKKTKKKRFTEFL